MTRWSSRAVAVATLAGLGVCAPVPARAQAPASANPTSAANLDGLTVSGKGVVGGKPNRMEIDLEVMATSEMSADVIVKYRDAKKRLQEAFATLKMKNITVEERALAVDQKGADLQPVHDGDATRPPEQGRGPVDPQARCWLRQHPRDG